MTERDREILRRVAARERRRLGIEDLPGPVPIRVVVAEWLRLMGLDRVAGRRA